MINYNHMPKESIEKQEPEEPSRSLEILRGKNLLEQGDTSAALQIFIQHKDAEGLYLVGRALEEQGRREEAAKVYVKASELVP
jgi:Flp pilus assembly protein TadD